MSRDLPIRFALLRDGVEWEGVRTALASAGDGSLHLVRVPAPAAGAPVRLPAPFAAAFSGIAVDGCGRVFVADAAANRLLMEWPDCDFRYALPVDAPAGLAVGSDTLYVAQPSGSCVLALLLPTLELTRRIDEGLDQPVGVAPDDDGGLYVLDRGLKRVVRFRPDGSRDQVYDAAMATALGDPQSLALSGKTLLVSDRSDGRVYGFEADGVRVVAVMMPDAAAQPSLIATHNGQVYVADAVTGRLFVFDVASGVHQGIVPGFCAPVAAMACDRDGTLLLKTDGSDAYLRMTASAGCAAAGTIEAGPLDAGVENDWERIAVDADVPAAAGVGLKTFTSATPAPPGTGDWRDVPSLDALLDRDPGPASGASGLRRFLWVQVSLVSEDGRTSPTLRQVRAQTVGVSYLEHLPRIYRRDDAPERFLERLLALARSAMEDWDAELDGMHRRFDPATAPADGLRWLAESLALPVPPGIDAAAFRALLARVPALYAYRGTRAALVDLAEIYAGVRPHVFEAFEARRVWQLAGSCSKECCSGTSRLGVDTMLAAALPDGLVVPGQIVTDPEYAGLRGEYYAGLEFDRHVERRADRTIDFAAARSVVPREGGEPLDRFSVRWSGQIKPRYSETYTLSVAPGGGVRLWIDGAPLVDSWSDAVPSPRSARVLLDAGRWHVVTIELHRNTPDPAFRLEWTSRSTPLQVVPADCLYSVLDDRADLSARRAPVADVGKAVVGETGPLAASEFGAGLFSEYSHLFTVVVPAARCAGSDGADRRRALRALVDSEKPAHTDYHLCFADARMRVGFQARLGVDAIVANGPPPLRLDETALGRDSFLGGAPPGGARLGSRARLGEDTLIG